VKLSPSSYDTERLGAIVMSQSQTGWGGLGEERPSLPPSSQ
jgi:hypothetical protein